VTYVAVLAGQKRRAKPSAQFDADRGGGFIQPDVWIGIVYDGMVKN